MTELVHVLLVAAALPVVAVVAVVGDLGVLPHPGLAKGPGLGVGEFLAHSLASNPLAPPNIHVLSTTTASY